MFEAIYEVDKNIYRDFIRGIKKGSCDIDVNENEDLICTRMVSKLTNVCYCARVTNKKEEQEKYYIFGEPVAAEDSQPIEVHPKFIIDNVKDLQKILDYLAEQRKKGDKDE